MLSILYLLLLLAGLEAVNQLLMALYTRFERSIDRKKMFSGENVSAKPNPAPTRNAFKTILYKFYHYAEHAAYGLMRYNLLRVGRIPSFTVRRFLYRRVYCMDITRNTNIGGNCEIRSPWNVHADRCSITLNCILDARSGLYIGEDVVLGSGVHIWTNEHSVDDPKFSVLPENAQPVRIGCRAWIASDSTILPGRQIGEGAVVCARACVTKDCEPYGVYGGVPARKLRERNRDLDYQLERRPSWFFF